MKYYPQVKSLTTKHGRPIMVGGLFTEENADMTPLIRALERINFDNIGIYGVDMILAEACAAGAPDSMKIAAVSADNFARYPFERRTGGVIGSPVEDPVSSYGDIEVLADGYLMISYPGGPGIASNVSEELLRKLGDRLKPLADKAYKDADLGAILDELGIESALIVFDGSGSGSGPLVYAR